MKLEDYLAEILELWLNDVFVNGKYKDNNFMNRNKVMKVCKKYFGKMGHWRRRKNHIKYNYDSIAGLIPNKKKEIVKNTNDDW